MTQEVQTVKQKGTTMQLLLPWLANLPLQQQAVLVMACRGFDGSVKHSAHKPLVRTLRAHVMLAAQYGRPWSLDDGFSSFMTLDYIKDFESWRATVEAFMAEVDSYNTHALLHLVHAAQILGYKLPHLEYRKRWCDFYEYFCGEVLHSPPETCAFMDSRLNDWGQRDWVATQAGLDECQPIPATPEMEAKAHAIAQRYGGGAIPYHAALAALCSIDEGKPDLPKVKALDLSNIMHHAFTFGWEASSSGKTFAEGWTHYDPTTPSVVRVTEICYGEKFSELSFPMEDIKAARAGVGEAFVAVRRAAHKVAAKSVRHESTSRLLTCVDELAVALGLDYGEAE